MILTVDPEIEQKMEQVAIRYVSEEWVAWRATYLCVYLASEDGTLRFAQLAAKCPALLNLEMISEMQQILHDFGYVTLF